MKKRTALGLSMLLLASFLFTGCESLAYNMLEELQNQLTASSSSAASSAGGAEAAESTPQKAPAASFPLPFSLPQAQSLPEDFSAYDLENMDLYQYFFLLLGMNNAALRMNPGLEGLRCETEIFLGGTPLVGYYEESEDIWLVFWLEGDYDAMMRAWESAERDSEYATPTYNCFPDDFTVERMVMSGSGDYLGDLLGTPYPSLDEVTEILGQSPAEELVPAETGEGMEGGYPFDVYLYTYILPGGTIALRYTEAGELVNMEMY